MHAHEVRLDVDAGDDAAGPDSAGVCGAVPKEGASLLRRSIAGRNRRSVDGADNGPHPHDAHVGASVRVTHIARHVTKRLQR